MPSFRNATSLALTVCSAFFASFAPSAFGQTLVFRVTTPTENRLVLPGGSTAIQAPAIGTPVDFQVSVSYEGPLQATLTRADFVAPADFSITAAPTIPRELRTGESIRWDMRFIPRTGSRPEAQFAVTLREAERDGTVLGQSVLILTLVGNTPDLVVSAVDQLENYRRLMTGDRVVFPATAIGTNSAIGIAVANRGSGSGRLESAALSSPHFQLIQLPLTPANIESTGELRFAVRYSPLDPGPHTAALRIGTSNQEVTVTLEGSPSPAPTSLLRYFRVDGPEPVAVSPGSVISLREAETGRRSTATLRVTNTGTAETAGLLVATDGGAFTLAEGGNVVAIRPGASLDLTVIFQPSQPGPAEGTLRIGPDTFLLRSTGLTSQLAYRYDSASGIVSTAPGGRVLLSSVPLGGVLRRSFTVENTGNQPSAIPIIQLGTGQAGVQLEDVPGLPLTLGAGESASFTLRFSPPAIGTFGDTLLIGSAVFDITAGGNRPPPLPPYEISTSIGTGEPNRQAQISLRLAEPYSLPLTGRITMRVAPNGAGVDPNAQFLAGGRTVSFRIPANTRDAIFDTDSLTAAFQTGTLAGTITFVPAFLTLGDTDITPEAPQTASLSVAPGPPRLLNARIIDSTTTSFALVVNGFVTNRQLTAMHIRLTTADSESPSTIDLSSVSQAFFGSALAEPFGGTFSLTLPFTARPGAPRARSVSVTLENNLGRSDTLTATVP